MKNILYKLTFAVLVATSFTSCVTVEDDFDDDRPDQNGNYLNPPAWIQGKWSDIGLDDFPVEGERTYEYRFTSDDFLMRVLGIDSGFKELLELTQDSDEPLTVEEVINDSVYSLSITGPGANVHHDFRKTSDSTFYDKVAYDHPIQTGTGIYFKRYRQ